MKKLTDSDSLYCNHRDTSHLVAWLSGSFADLEYEGQAIVDDYWQRFSSGRKGRKHSEQGSLGLRLRARDSGAFSLEWYELGVLGKSRKPIAASHIRKGRTASYGMKALLNRQPSWVCEIVQEVEEVLAEIRKRQALLIKLRFAVRAYTAEVTGDRQTGTRMIAAYRHAKQEPGESSA